MEDTKQEFNKGMNLLNSIINETFCRYNDLDKQEFKEKLKLADSTLSENKLVKMGIYDIMVELIKQTMKLEQKTNIMVGTMQIALKEKENGRK